MQKLFLVAATCSVAALALACSRDSQKASGESPSASASAKAGGTAAPSASSAAPQPPAASADVPTGTRPGPPAGPKLYVSNEASGDVTIVDVATGKVDATLPVGKRPRGIQRAPNGSAVYV